MSSELAYLEPRAKMYLEAWPRVPIVIAPVAQRLLDAGVLLQYTTEGETHFSTLTPLGEHMVFLYQTSMSFPVATVRRLLNFWPLSKLMNRDPQATKFVEMLYRMNWNDQEIREYISARKDEIVTGPLQPNDVHDHTGLRADEHPALKNLMAFDVSGLEPLKHVPGTAAGVVDDFDFPDDIDTPAGVMAQIAESTGLDVSGPEFDAVREELAFEELVDQIDARETDIVCNYCEGTRVDPFEGDKPCPLCGDGTQDMPTEEDWDIL